jgi:hypothetical protein
LKGGGSGLYSLEVNDLRLTEQRIVMRWQDLPSCTDNDLGGIDPVVQNLLIAKGIPALEDLEVRRYQREVDGYAVDIERILPTWEREFWRTPSVWENDIHMLRLGAVCHYLDQHVGIRYNEEEKYVQKISYTNPSDLFLNGVIDTRRGTCGNMATLQYAIGWRLGWPVTLTKAWWHTLLRFDNGEVIWNVEATDMGRGGFSCQGDEYTVKELNVAPEHVKSGSDLNSLTPHQVLGVFLGSRGRHWWDVGRVPEARADFERALVCYPESRVYRHMISKCDLYDDLKANLGVEVGIPTSDVRPDYVNSITVGAGCEESHQ